jgi:peptidoglycan/LPS O-acetylase OafA/YrhL
MTAIVNESATGIDESSGKSSVEPASVARGMQSQRIYYLDNLRAIAMLLGVFLHSALAYAQPAQSVWLATDSSASVPLDASIWFIHLFRMGLFFLLSGYFAKLVIERKGLRHFLWNRFVRIVVPFVLFYPFLLAAMTVVIVFSLSYLVEPRGLMGFIAAAVKDSSGSQKREPLTTMHLWFLYYLMAFSAIGALLRNVKRLKLEKWSWQPKLLFLCPLLLVPGSLAAGAPMPAPESFIPHWWPFVFYGLFYVAGWQLFGREQFLDSWRPYVWHVAAICMLLFVPYYMLLPVLDLSTIVAGGSSQVFWIRFVEACLTAYLSVLLTITSLLVGQRYLAGKSPFLSLVADSSYWVYLLHLPIVLFLQTLLVPLVLPWWLKLSLVLIGTVIPCMITYLVFVRYTPVGWLLHGRRSFP